MAKKPFHAVVGVASGGVAATLMAKHNNEEPLALALQAIGGTLGGYHGGILPDALEPALTPIHRGVAHSLVLATAAGTTIVKKGKASFNEARLRVRQLEEALAAEVDPWRRLWLAIGLALSHLALGYAVGFAAGYASHLVLDAGTPASLPLIAG